MLYSAKEVPGLSVHTTALGVFAKLAVMAVLEINHAFSV